MTARSTPASAPAESSETAPWTVLPEGYTMPGINYRSWDADGNWEPAKPLCSHGVQASVGWASDCNEPATHKRPYSEYGTEYACSQHATPER